MVDAASVGSKDTSFMAETITSKEQLEKVGTLFPFSKKVPVLHSEVTAICKLLVTFPSKPELLHFPFHPALLSNSWA